jgi:ATP-dependent exoDNAse (exonuclease V) alpha subunit
LHNANDPAAEQNPVRNGNRWRVAAVDTKTNRLAAERLDDGARVVFGGDYLREHINHGYAVTVHSAQGATADTTHAVLDETATRALFYVAMTRGRDSNTAYLYQHTSEHECPTNHHQQRMLCNAEAACGQASCSVQSSPTMSSRSPHTTSQR